MSGFKVDSRAGLTDFVLSDLKSPNIGDFGTLLNSVGLLTSVGPYKVSKTLAGDTRNSSGLITSPSRAEPLFELGLTGFRDFCEVHSQKDLAALH